MNESDSTEKTLYSTVNEMLDRCKGSGLTQTEFDLALRGTALSIAASFGDRLLERIDRWLETK